MKKTRVALGLAAVCALALSGCGANGQEESNASSFEAPETLDALVEAAKEEGSVKVYTPLPEGDQEKLDKGFEEKYGIKVESLRLGGNTLPTRFMSELQAGTPTGDVVLPTTLDFLADETKSGVLVPFEDSGVPELLDGLPEEAILKDYEGGPLYQLLATGFIYNTDLVSESDIPKSWEDLVNSDLMAQTCAVDPSTSESLIVFMDEVRSQGGEGTLKKLGSEMKRWYPSVVPMNEAVVSGECAIGLNSAEFFALGLESQGAPTAFAQAPSAALPIVSVAVNAEAEHPNAARLYMQYALSEDGGSALQDPSKGSYGAYHADELPEGYKIMPLDQQKAAIEDSSKILGLLGF